LAKHISKNSSLFKMSLLDRHWYQRADQMITSQRQQYRKL